MRTIGLHKTLNFVLAAALLGPLCAAASACPQNSSQKPTGDPVADASRKAREQKNKEAKPKKVYTNEDLGSLPANAISTPGAVPEEKPKEGAEGQPEKAKAGAKPGAGAKPEGGVSSEADKNQETVWRGRFRDAYGKLARLEKELDILQREESKADLQYYPDPQKALAEGYSRKDINDKQAKITEKQQQIDQQKQHISDLEDDLRRAGGDPGWTSP